MTLEFLTPQPQHEGAMYRHPSPAQNYSAYNYNQTTQYQSEYPHGNSFQSTGTADNQLPPTTNSWVSAGFPMSGVPHVDWGSSQDPYNTFSGQTQVGPVSSQNTEELDFYQGFGPSTPAANSVSQALHRPAMRSPYHDWMRSTSYRINPQTGKTRTKDKYRVVYSDHQRLELEKEFHYSRYITIRRKAELAVSLGLSERQVKIWFQNRRAKERKHNKKRIAMEDAGDQKELDPSSDEKRDVGLVEIKKEKALDGELLDPLGRELHLHQQTPPTTPEILEIGGKIGRTPSNTQLELTAHPQLHSIGACQLQLAHVAVTASLFNAMTPMN